MHYLAKKFSTLPEDEKSSVLNEIAEIYSAPAETMADKISLVLMSDFTDSARERTKNFGKMQGISSGYQSIDKLTKGFVGGELTVIAGKTSYGKTTLAMNMANNIALAGHTVLFVTMEMTHVELTSRYMFINGGDNDAYQTVAAHTAFQRNDELNWQNIDALIGHAIDAMNVSLIVIDHLHYFTRELDNTAEDLGRITKELKKNAIRHNVPVLLISHVRKTNYQSEATIDDLRGSSYIAQDADIVLMVGRNEGDMCVRIEKNRNRGFDYDDATVSLDFDRTRLSEKTTWNTSVPYWNDASDR